MKKGVFFVNLGFLDSIDLKDVKKYFDEFLMDFCVIDVFWWVRIFLVCGIILNICLKKLVEVY